MMLELIQDNFEIEEALNYYFDCIRQLNSYTEKFKEDIIRIANYQSMEANMKEELDRRMKEIDDKYKRLADGINRKYDSTRNKYEDNLKSIEIQKQDKITELLTPLNELITRKDSVVNHLESLNKSNSITPVYTEDDLANLPISEITEYLEDVNDLIEEILEINISSIDTNSIDKDFWLLANKLRLEDNRAQDVIRAINIILVFVVLMKFSNLITAMLSIYSGSIIVKNFNSIKPLQEYKNYIYPVFENTEVIKGNIENVVNSFVQDKINPIIQKIEELGLLEDEELQKLEFNKMEEKELVEDEFIINRDKILEEIKERKQRELESLVELITEKESDLGNIIDKISLELNDLRYNLQKKIEEMNRLELAIVNDNQIINLENIHLGREVLPESVKEVLKLDYGSINKFEDMPFGSYLFIYGDNKRKMQNFMQYLQAQFASRLRGDLLRLNIVDPLELGDGLNTSGFKDMGFHYNRSEVESYIESLLNRYNTDSKQVLFGYSDIRDFNKDKYNTGSSIYPYNLNLIQNVNIFNEIDKYLKILRTTQNGVINFILISDNLLLQEQESVGEDEVKKDQLVQMLNMFSAMFNDRSGNFIEMEILQEENIERTYKVNNSVILRKLLKEIDKDLEKYLIDLNNIAKKHDIDKFELKKFKPMFKGKKLKSDGLFEYRALSDRQFRNIGQKLKANYDNAKTPIFFFNDFIKRVMGNNPTFYKEPLKGVLFHFGYEDGDVDKPFGVPFNDYNIHAYLGGRTGMGKSNAANVGINAALNLYSPDALEIYYMDFKEAEGAKYKRNITPHFRCIATTSDPGYLLSLFKHIDGRMRERQNRLLPMYNAGKLDDIRENREEYLKMKKEFRDEGRDLDKELPEMIKHKRLTNIGDVTKIENAPNLQDGEVNTQTDIERKVRELKGTQVSEIVIIIDEFTEALKADPEIVKEILGHIDSFSRLGRATGVHLFLMSQDVPDKMDAGTMGQIVTRLSLPVTTEATSKTLVGNEAAADPEYQSKGNLLFNDRGGDVDANVRIRIPIIQPEDMDENLSKIREFGLNRGYKINCVLFNHDDPVFYKEDAKVEYIEDMGDGDATPSLEIFLKEKGKSLINNDFTKQVAIGGNVEYTDSSNPVGFQVGLDEGENIVVISQSSKKRIEMLNTLVANYTETCKDGDWMILLRGNKDYTNYDITEVFKSKHPEDRIIEIDSHLDLLSELEWLPLRNIETIISSRGKDVFEDIKNIGELTDENYIGQLDFFMNILNNVKGLEDKIRKCEEFNKKTIADIINFARPHLSDRLIVVEGVERIGGLGYGVDYSEADRIKHLINTAPYYGARIVFTASTEPQSFNRLEDCFKHRLLGTLDIMTIHKYRFMRETPDLYGGYSNLVQPDRYFKFKIFNIPEVDEDVAEDNRIMV